MDQPSSEALTPITLWFDANHVVVRGGAHARELTALALLVGIVHERDEALLDGDHARAQVDVAVLPFARMAAAHHDRRVRRLERG